MSSNSEERRRARDLGIAISSLPPGPNNAITDVPDVLVGQVSITRDEPVPIRTGVTMIVPRSGDIWTDYAFAATHVLNGNGEMTGIPWIEESGMLGSPIGITNTNQVGLVRDFLVRESYRLGVLDGFHLPVVTETWDGWLSTIESFALTDADVASALAQAACGPVAEGNTGGGTGMICHEFKGGTGSSSRLIRVGDDHYTVGVLVQANYGLRADLRVDGVPVGRLIGPELVATPWPTVPGGGSIIVVIATDAPLLPTQCGRLARRATVGLARVGGYGHDSSGDLFLAFSVGNHLPAGIRGLREVRCLPNEAMDVLFHAVVDATEESILNALCMAQTMTGREGRVAHAIPLDTLARALGADPGAGAGPA